MIEPGIEGTASMQVDETDTAITVGSGDVPVLATPCLIALCERATVDAVRGHLDDAATTVGVRVVIDHTGASPVGATVQARAVLSRVDGRRLTFDVEATDERGPVAEGTIDRVVVDRGRFVEGLAR